MVNRLVKVVPYIWVPIKPMSVRICPVLWSVPGTIVPVAVSTRPILPAVSSIQRTAALAETVPATITVAAATPTSPLLTMTFLRRLGEIVASIIERGFAEQLSQFRFTNMVNEHTALARPATEKHT